MAGEIEVARLVTRLTADSSQFNSVMGKSIQTATSWGEKIKQAIVNVAVTKGLGLVSNAAKQVTSSLVNVAKAGAGLPGIANAFNRNAQQFGVSLEAMQRAASGTVSDFELMKNANIALTGAGHQLGVEFGKNLPALMAGARAAAAATGQSADFLFNSLVTGVKRSSPLLIDNTGIVLKMGEANAAMAAKVGKSVNELTSQEKSIAILNATVEAANKLVAQTGGAGLTTAEKVASLGTAMKNFKDQVAVGLNPVLGQVTGILLKLVNTVLPPLQDLIVNKIGPGLSVVLDVVDGWVTKFTLASNAAKRFVDNTTEGMLGMAPGIADAGETVLEKLLIKWSDAAAKALVWGAKVVSEFAVGMTKGAAQALTAAMNYISGLLGGWLAPSSPPKIMPNLDKWAQSSMNLYLHSMTEADFGILDAMQGPIQTALSRLMDAGKIDQKQSVKLFRGLSEGLAKAAATGEMPTEILDKLRKTTGAYGKDLANLAEKQFKLAAATKAVKEAEEALERARTAQKDAQDNVSKLADEYNALLAAGADPAVLAAKRAEFEAAKGQLAVADDQVNAAEMQNEEAKKGLEPLQEQVALQQKILDQMFKMTEPMTAVTDALTGALGKLAAGAPLEMPTPEFSGEGIANSLGSAFENAKEMIKGKLQGLFRPVREAWLTEAKPAIEEFKQAWYDFTIKLKLWWYQNGESVISKIKESIQNTKDRFAEWGEKINEWKENAGQAFSDFKEKIQPFIDFWNEYLSPIFDVIIENIKTYVLPLFTELGELIGVIFVGLLKLAWQELKDKLIYYLDILYAGMEAFKQWWDTGGGAEMFESWRSVMEKIGDFLKNVTDKVAILKDKLKNFELPDWLQRKSPSPIEQTLMGMRDLMNDLSRQQMPSFQAALAGMPALSVSPVGAGGGNTYNYNMEVSTRAETPSVIQDFEMLKFLAPR